MLECEHQRRVYLFTFSDSRQTTDLSAVTLLVQSAEETQGRRKNSHGIRGALEKVYYIYYT